jgi:hypothetical protein
MSNRKQDIALFGVGAAACAVCCAGPIIGFFAALGLGTLIGIALFGSVGLAVAAIGALLLVRRRRRQVNACGAVGDQPVELVQRP